MSLQSTQMPAKQEKGGNDVKKKRDALKTTEIPWEQERKGNDGKQKGENKKGEGREGEGEGEGEGGGGGGQRTLNPSCLHMTITSVNPIPYAVL